MGGNGSAMTKLTGQRQIRLMIFLCAAVYFASYVSRINFGAVILEIVHAEGYPKPAISMAVTVSFITYGAGQLISGYLGDFIRPKYLIFTGLLVTAALNALIPFCPGPGAMTAVWGINGFAQALLWPPLVKLMTGLFTPEVYRRASVRVSWGSSFGTIAVYLAAPLCILWSGWKSVFFLSTAVCAVIAAVWMIFCGRMEKGLFSADICREEPAFPPPEPPAAGSFPAGVAAALGGIMAAIVCQGALRDGVTTWMPSFIAETYRLGNTVSILTGVILPVFSIVCFQFTLWMYNQKAGNELLLSGGIFFTGFLCAAVLRMTASYQAALSAALLAVLTGCMHGVNLLLICMVPPHFAKYGRVSAISGILNSCTYIGSAVSIYGTAFLSERFGWNAILFVWAAVALLGAIICLAFSKRWGRIRTQG